MACPVPTLQHVLELHLRVGVAPMARDIAASVCPLSVLQCDMPRVVSPIPAFFKAAFPKITQAELSWEGGNEAVCSDSAVKGHA